jgi:fructoselysine 6-kinase
MKIVALTVLCVDFYKQQSIVNIGGNSLNFATQCRKDGFEDVSLIGAIGNDIYGEKISKYLCEQKIDKDYVYVKEGKTASNTILITEKGERYFPDGAWDGGVYQNFVLSQEDWDFAYSHDLIAIPGNNINLMECLKRNVKQKCITVDFLDLRDYELMEKTMPNIQLSFVSGDDEVIKFAEQYSKKVDGVITITLGAEGSISFIKGKGIKQEAIKINNVKDTTGCGDAYQASYATTFCKTKDIKKALEAGSKSAAKILTHLGAVE